MCYALQAEQVSTSLYDGLDLGDAVCYVILCYVMLCVKLCVMQCRLTKCPPHSMTALTWVTLCAMLP
jgi:hypothetical protein